MTTQLKKTLLIGAGVFVLIAASLGAIYLVRQPTNTRPSPTPTPKVAIMSSPSVTPVPIGINEVTPANAAKCELNFVVACASSSPSPSPSGTPIVYVSPSPSTPASADLDCVSKEVYADDARNRAGFYYLESRIAEASSLASGTTIVYSIIAKNHGGSSVPDTKITDTLSSNLTFVDADSDCTYDSGTRTVTCTIGTLAAGAQAQRSIRARINVSSNTSIANTAEVFSSNGQRNSCSVQLDATGKIITPPSPVPTELPQAGVFEVTAGTIGVGMVFLILGALGLLLL
ncbi:MAG: hypothetical protein DPW11_00265 [bacterium]|nr:DUF11 domain-containing protein [Candidatus Microgenomates bacterium CPR3]MCQ3944203.1 hypothetical protein [bacterium]RIK51982.1 MAG: hypothetical protein DCC61_01170 [Candidatus Microgenomates bacterium]